MVERAQTVAAVLPGRLRSSDGGVVDAEDVSGSFGSIVEFWSPGAAEALPAGETDRSNLIYVARGDRALRYRGSQEQPNKVVFGNDPGIRALEAADAGDADLMIATLLTDPAEVLPDYSVFNVPLGVITRARLFAQHDAAADFTLQAFAYEVQAGNDDVRRAAVVAYARGLREPLGIISEAQTPRQAIDLSLLVDASAAAKQITFITSGFQLASDANGHWYVEFETFQQ